MGSSNEFEGHWVYKCQNCGRMFYFHGKQARALDQLRGSLNYVNSELLINVDHMGYILSRGAKCCDEPTLIVIV